MELFQLLDSCSHHFVCTQCGTDADTDTCEGCTLGHLGAKCDVCDKRGGWYCPKSPDHTCYYFSRLDAGATVRHVELRNGQRHLLTGYTKQYESEDWCIFCGEPDERK